MRVSAVGSLLTTIGIVYGDIGTSPLYAINQIFFGYGNTAATEENVYGAIGLVFWALTLIIALKYVIFVLRADHNGEGGVFALLGLVGDRKARGAGMLVAGLIFAAGLLVGDGLITPAISVISAVEGLRIATSVFDPFIVPLTIAILTMLFWAQRKGTQKVGVVFGPVVVLWFLSIAALGTVQIARQLAILNALNPVFALRFLSILKPGQIMAVIGAVMLVVTGGEALYADMGHVGKTSIRQSWFFIVYPSLLLNYFGQGAYLLGEKPIFNGNIFYSIVPTFALYPMIVLATLATIIASQALITGLFSLTTQAIALELSPRFKITHTSSGNKSQIYLPAINWLMYAGCVLMVIEFGSSANLAAAYGFAVAGVMFVTSLAMCVVAQSQWAWSARKAGLFFGGFAAIDAIFIAANSMKFMEGAYVPLFIGVLLFLITTTWQWGRRLLTNAFRQYTSNRKKNMAWLLGIKRHLLEHGGVFDDGSQRFVQLERIVIFMLSHAVEYPSDAIPVTLSTHMHRTGALPKWLIMLTIQYARVPNVHKNRYHVSNLGAQTLAIKARFGFMEQPQMNTILKDLRGQITVDLTRADIEVGEEEIMIRKENTGPLTRFRATLFRTLLRFSVPAYRHFGIIEHAALSKTVVPVLYTNFGASVQLPQFAIEDKK